MEEDEGRERVTGLMTAALWRRGTDELWDSGIKTGGTVALSQLLSGEFPFERWIIGKTSRV